MKNFGWIQEEPVTAYFKSLYCHFSGRSEVCYDKTESKHPVLDQDSNSEPSEERTKLTATELDVRWA